MFMGSYQAGDRVPLVVEIHQLPGFGGAQLPDAAPAARVFDAAGAVVADYALPPLDPVSFPGLFCRPIHLDGRYAPGQYAVRYAWAVAAAPRAALSIFEVRPGGHGDGTFIACYAFHRPHAEMLVAQMDSGKLFRGRNPYV
jgi:hypothetical protein